MISNFTDIQVGSVLHELHEAAFSRRSSSSTAPIFASIVIVLLSILKFIFTQRSKSNLRYPPGPKPRFFWGNALEFPDVRNGEHISLKIQEWMKQYGKTISVHVPLIGRMIFTSDAELIHYVTVKKNFPKSPTYNSLNDLFGSESIVINTTNINPNHDTKAWMKKRRSLNPGFTDKFLKNMVCVMCEKMERLISRLDEHSKLVGTITNTLNEMQSVTADIIVQISLGEDWGPPNENPGLEYLRELQEILSVFANDPFEKMFGFSKKRRIKKLGILLENIFTDIVDKQLESLSRSDHDKEEESILSIMIKTMKKSGKGQDKQELDKHDLKIITDQMKTLFFAGHDTTATTLSFALWLLSQNEGHLEKLRAELKSKNIWKNGSNDVPTYEMLQECQVLEAVIYETLRLYPPGGSARYTRDSSEEYKGFAISNTVVVIDHYCLHRNPEYFENPDDFLPERFMNNTSSIGSKGSDFPTFIPFSKGPRDCVGKYFALLEAKIILSRLVLRYDFKCVNTNDGYGYRITGQPKDGNKLQFSLLQN